MIADDRTALEAEAGSHTAAAAKGRSAVYQSYSGPVLASPMAPPVMLPMLH
jgi:hypothetical protein